MLREEGWQNDKMYNMDQIGLPIELKPIKLWQKKEPIK